MQVDCAEMWPRFGSGKTKYQGQQFDGYCVDPRWESLTIQGEGDRHVQDFNTHVGVTRTSAMADLRKGKRFDRWLTQRNVVARCLLREDGDTVAVPAYIGSRKILGRSPKVAASN